jgi:hypothetical protein
MVVDFKSNARSITIMGLLGWDDGYILYLFFPIFGKLLSNIMKISQKIAREKKLRPKIFLSETVKIYLIEIVR